MPFLRRMALARSRCFSGSQRAQVSGVSPTLPCLPNARNPLLLTRLSEAGAGCRCPSGVAPAGLRSPHGGRGSPPRQSPPIGLHSRSFAWKEGARITMYGPRFSTAAGLRSPSRGILRSLRPEGGSAAPAMRPEASPGRGPDVESRAAYPLGSTVAMAWPRPAEWVKSSQRGRRRPFNTMAARRRGPCQHRLPAPPAVGVSRLSRPSVGGVVPVPPSGPLPILEFV